MENQETYNGKTPFYMTYPMQNLYLAEMEYEKDMQRMMELYPKEIQRLQDMVARRVDQMEYEGSRIYDENPDRQMLMEEAHRLYEDYMGPRAPMEDAYMEPRGRFFLQPPWESNHGDMVRDENWLRQLIEVLLNNEIYRRRCRNRRCRRWW